MQNSINLLILYFVNLVFVKKKFVTVNAFQRTGTSGLVKKSTMIINVSFFYSFKLIVLFKYLYSFQNRPIFLFVHFKHSTL